MRLRLLAQTERGSRDLLLSATAENTVDEVGLKIAKQTDAVHEGLWRRTTQSWELVPGEATIRQSGLLNGDEVCVQLATTNASRVAVSLGTALDVVGGPDAGRSLPFELGSIVTVGRGASCSLRLRDRAVGDDHFMVSLTPGAEAAQILVRDTNRDVRVEGVRVDETADVAVGALIVAGNSSFRLRHRSGLPDERTDGRGQVAFNRTPEFTTAIPSIDLPVISVPERKSNRGFRVAAVAGPALMGLSMWLVFANSRYLFFAAMSPVVYLITKLDDRFASGRKFRRARMQFRTELKDRRSSIAGALRIERSARDHRSPDLSLVLHWARIRSHHLWHRQRRSPHFLLTRLGLGSRRSSIAWEEAPEGDEELREQLAAVDEGARMLVDSPIDIDLTEHSSIAIVGQQSTVTDVAAAIVMQAAVNHSAEDLVIAALCSPGDPLVEVLKWIPNCYTPASPLTGAHLEQVERGEASSILRQLVALADDRTQVEEASWPRVLFVIDEAADPDMGLISRLSQLATNSGFSLIWRGSRQAGVPMGMASVLTLPPDDGQFALLELVDGSEPSRRLSADRLNLDLAAHAARGLAPMRDNASFNASTALPAKVSLFECLQVAGDTLQTWVSEQWKRPRIYSLPAIVGWADEAPFEVDFVKHGPHALIGGTSGAGKSVLVESLLISAAAMNSPDDLNFLFVDYKGGALSDKFKELPHTVGAVTNLTPAMAQRALDSLNAELDRRMREFEGRDMREMHSKEGQSPASLLIVIDEFAALVRAMPDFIDGVVNVAERGRSLGIHLLLSTQRPSGAINENIQQNTSLRIALRMLDSGESANVIGSPEAAHIPLPLKGRAIARLGAQHLIPFQAAWSGDPARVMASAQVEVWPYNSVDVHPDVPDDRAGLRVLHEKDVDNQFDAVVAAIKSLDAKRGRSVWQDPLPEVLSLEALQEAISSSTAEPGDVRRLVKHGPAIDSSPALLIGLRDQPRLQLRDKLTFDLGLGPVGIFGAGRSGKTTALRAAALSFRAKNPDGTIVAFDFGSGELAHMADGADVALQADLETVSRSIALLEAELTRRLAGDPDSSHQPVLVIVDRWDVLSETFSPQVGSTSAMRAWHDRLWRTVREGRQVAIGAVVTSTAALSGRLMSSLADILVLKQSTDDGYARLGCRPPGEELPPGRAIDRDGHQCQVAWVEELPARSSSSMSIVGSRLPNRITVNEAPKHDAKSTARLGIADLTHDVVHLNARSSVVVIGAGRSGKSTVTAAIASSLSDAVQEHRLFIGSAESPLRTVAAQARWALNGDQALHECQAMVDRAETNPTDQLLIVWDDLDAVAPDERQWQETLRVVSKLPNITIVASMRSLTGNALQTELRKACRQFVLLQPDVSAPSPLPNVRATSLRPGLSMPQGRALTDLEGTQTIIQCFQVFEKQP